jgi:hypothetical protein
MPNLLGVLETVLYVDAFERACPFYEQVLELNSIYRDQRLCAYDVGSRGVLLLFLRGHSLETVKLPGGTIPPHDGQGPVHIAFSIAADDLAGWEARLSEAASQSRAAPSGPVAASVFIFAIPTTICSNWRRRACGRVIDAASRECANAGSGLTVNRYDRAAGNTIVGRSQKHNCCRNLLNLGPQRKIGLRHRASVCCRVHD